MHPDAPAPADQFPPTAPPPIRSLRFLSVAASTLIIVSAIAWAITVHIAAWTHYGSLARYTPEGFSGALGVQAVGIRPIKDSIINNGLAALASAVAATVFIVWLSRARRNSELLSAARHRLGRGWVVGSWFLPVGNLVMPFLVIADVWRASEPQSVTRRPVGTGLVTVWWSTAVCTWGLYWFATFVRNASTEPQRMAAVLFTVQGLLTIVVAVLAVKVIHRITRWQTAR